MVRKSYAYLTCDLVYMFVSSVVTPSVDLGTTNLVTNLSMNLRSTVPY